MNSLRHYPERLDQEQDLVVHQEDQEVSYQKVVEEEAHQAQEEEVVLLGQEVEVVDQGQNPFQVVVGEVEDHPFPYQVVEGVGVVQLLEEGVEVVLLQVLSQEPVCYPRRQWDLPQHLHHS